MGKLDEALKEMGDRPFPTQVALCQISRARCCMRFGKYDIAEAALQTAWDLFDGENVRWGLAQVLTARGKLALAQGKVDTALEVLSDALTRYEYMEDVNAPWARLTHGQALLAKGDLDAAETCFADELHLNEDKDRHAVGLVAELGLLQVAGERGDWRMWRDMLSRIDTRLTIRQSATRDAIGMLEAAGHAAARNGGDAQPVWALATRLWGLLDAVEDVARIEALRTAAG
jgi:tetratricopeptide (TPR) repeat protein